MVDPQLPPDPLTRQVSGTDAECRFILALITRRTYHVDVRGHCQMLAEQSPLTIEVKAQEANPHLIAADTDLYPCKLFTDLVVQGHAYAHGPATSFTAKVLVVGRHRHDVRVFGDRRCGLTSTGRVVFGEPAAVERVPLTYAHAYGGVDHVAEAKYGDPLAALIPYLDKSADPSACSAFAYPRNFAGRGWVIEPDPTAIDNVVLPNLEDPDDLLTPDRLIAGAQTRWPAMPMAWGTDWISPGWFPRLGYFGFTPAHEPPSTTLPEVRYRMAGVDILANVSQEKKFNQRFTNGAHPGLHVPYLQGDEELVLTNLHPKYREWKLRLPGQRPRLWIDGREGRLKETKPQISSVIIAPDRDQVTVVWCGAAQALRTYLPQELAHMPFAVRW
ncbi:MAG: DUF2169 domain-containing protein [Planctomycetes bacterium]|nr:DUF2169 domain-containing protein [Planctomycetota bacterium]